MLIETGRLRLREFECSDWRAVLDYQRDPRYLRYYPWVDRTEADVREFVGMFLGWQGEMPRRRFQLGIARRSDGLLIGNCGIRRHPDNDTEAEIGYELNPDCWGNGYATEAAAAMVEFGFRHLGLERITSWCIADNAASARVLERLGFGREGRVVQSEYFKGRWWDALTFSLTADEWQGKPAIVYIETAIENDSQTDSDTRRNDAQGHTL